MNDGKLRKISWLRYTAHCQFLLRVHQRWDWLVVVVVAAQGFGVEESLLRCAIRVKLILQRVLVLHILRPEHGHQLHRWTEGGAPWRGFQRIIYELRDYIQLHKVSELSGV